MGIKNRILDTLINISLIGTIIIGGLAVIALITSLVLSIIKLF
jgi:hypothetical protein